MAVKDNLPILSVLYEAKQNEVEEVVAEAEIKKKQEDCFKDTFDITKYEDATGGAKIIKSLGFYLSVSTIKRKDADDIDIVKIDRKLLPYLTKLILDDKARVEAEFMEANKPKPTKKSSGGKRGKFTGEIRVVNTPETAEGKDFPFYFKGDENATFTKPTFTAKDGSYQNHKIKAVKNKEYMGGGLPMGDDGKCSGAVIWDRAIGSEAIKSTGLSPAQFRIRCSKSRLACGDMCAKCEGRNPDFFKSTYNLGAKSKGSKFNGQTYCQFIDQNLEYGDNQ